MKCKYCNSILVIHLEKNSHKKMGFNHKKGNIACLECGKVWTAKNEKENEKWTIIKKKK